MRALCLDLKEYRQDNFAENFLAFSSRLKSRHPNLVFADVTESLKKFGGEQAFLKELQQFNHDFFPNARAAIASTPFLAQVFSRAQEEYFVCPPDQEENHLNKLPLSELHNFEGLVAWSSQRQVEDIITFFKVLGFTTIGEIKSFEMSSFHQRWGKTGELLWKRLHGQERQIITPIKNNFSRVDHIELQVPISLNSHLLHCLESSARQLFNAVKRDQQEAHKIVIYLHCQCNYDVHVIEISPRRGYLNLVFVFEEIEKKLAGLDFDNPIRRIDVEMFSSHPTGQKFLSWYRQTNRPRKIPILSGFISPRTYDDFDDDYVAIDGHDEWPSKIEINGRPLQLEFDRNDNCSCLGLTKVFDTPIEIANFENYQMLSFQEQSFYGLGGGACGRGQLHFVALSPKGQRVCICYDQIEDKYYLKGIL